MAKSPRGLAYKDRFVWYLLEILSDRFDDVPALPELPFTDMTSRVPLVYRVNQREYTDILSAIQTGADLAFPEKAHELELIWALPSDYEPEEDFCLDYQTDDSSIISFDPQDPHTEPDVVPPGYLLSPFWVVEDVLPEFLPDWFAELITDIIEAFTGYEDDDVLCTIGSIPLPYDIGDLLAVLTDGLPRFTIEVDGAGTLEMHLLSVPLGGRLLVSVDIEFNPIDIIEGLFTEGFNLIELERDYSSTPPEFDVTHIEEIILESTGAHVIYCTFIPVLDLDAFPVKFGGGIRKIVWCPDAEPDEECEECPPEPTIPEIIADDTYFETEYVPVVFGEFYSATVAQAAAQAAIYDDTPQSVAPDVPVAAPNDVQKNALCYAVNRFVELYSSQKLCLIQSQNFIESLLSDFANAANDFYNTAAALMLPFYSANIFSCFVDDSAAMAALVDPAAIEELACYLYEELKTVAMSQANFDAAILDAATTLTGNAQDIACLMQNDSSEDIFIAFLLGYNIAIERQNAGDDLECPCETDTYWMQVFDFSLGKQDWIPAISASQPIAEHLGSYWSNKTSNPPNYAGCGIAYHFDLAYVIKACGVEMTTLGFTGVGSDSLRTAGWQYFPPGAGSERLTGSQAFLTTSGFETRNHYDAAETLSSEGYQVAIANAGVPSGSNYSYINRIVLYGLPNGASKPPGSVWVSAVPVSPNPLFP